MSADLLIPIIFIVIMYLVIGMLDDALTLISLAVLFIPVVLIFPTVVNNGSYTTFLGASIVGTNINLTLMANVFLTVPLFAVMRVLYLKKMIKDQKKEDIKEL